MKSDRSKLEGISCTHVFSVKALRESFRNANSVNYYSHQILVVERRSRNCGRETSIAFGRRHRLIRTLKD